jgi:hypothetical protein
MPLLKIRPFAQPVRVDTKEPFEEAGWPANRIELIGRCANQECASGWLHLFRKRSRPAFEGQWVCSRECMEMLIRSAIRRELEGRGSPPAAHSHRIPLGLLMLEKGWITPGQLRKALEAQRNAGSGRVGEWLVRQHATTETMVTRALSLQWSCPALSLDSRTMEPSTTVMPRLFLDAFGVVPLSVPSGKLLYLGFEEALDPVLALALERATGAHVESGIMQTTVFKKVLAGLLQCEFPAVQLCEANSEFPAAQLLAKAIERNEPIDSRLVRVHDFLWLRMNSSRNYRGVASMASVRDVVCTIGKF